MLVLRFRTGKTLYAVDGRQVVEVIPRVECRPIPHAPGHLIGMLCFRGHVVPVVDFAMLTGIAPCRNALSTRIIVTSFTDAGGTKQLLGIVAESVDEVYRTEPDQRLLFDMNLDEAPYLGGMLQLDEGLVQFVKPEKILDNRLQGALLEGHAESSA